MKSTLYEFRFRKDNNTRSSGKKKKKSEMRIDFKVNFCVVSFSRFFVNFSNGTWRSISRAISLARNGTADTKQTPKKTGMRALPFGLTTAATTTTTKTTATQHNE